MRYPPLLVGLLCAALLTTAISGQTPDRLYRLPIGDPERKTRDAPVVLDAITVTSSRELLAPSDLAARLKPMRLFLIGESHTSLEAHRVQRRLIEALRDAGRTVLIGLEMYPATAQTFLDQWTQGLLTEEGFVTLSSWYDHWGYNWEYYRDIFLFARDHRIPIVGLNVPREIVTAVRTKGLQNLAPEESAHMPPDGVDVESADHLAFFKASFGEGDQLHGGATEEALRSMLSAQATWDAAMGWNAVQALQERPDPAVIMVVLAGSGHVAYDVGIVRQARRWLPGGIATLIPVPIATRPGGTTIDRVQASYADYVWGVLPERDSAFPRLGVATRAGEGGRPVVVLVEDGSAAALAGLEENDVILSIDGQVIADQAALRGLLSRKQWGDSASVVVRRGVTEETFTAYFRRAPAG